MFLFPHHSLCKYAKKHTLNTNFITYYILPIFELYTPQYRRFTQKKQQCRWRVAQIALHLHKIYAFITTIPIQPLFPAKNSR